MATEALVAGCVAHRGKKWASVRDKRAPRLGTAAIVRKVESNAGKEAVRHRSPVPPRVFRAESLCAFRELVVICSLVFWAQVKLTFESDGETMWWRPEFLQPAHAFASDATGRCAWRPEHEGDTAASECLGLHYADNTDVVGGCAVLNISYTSVRGGRAQAPAGLLFGLARLIQEEVHLSDAFDRQGLAWDGMLGLAPPHPKHRVFERRYLARTRSGPSGRQSSPHPHLILTSSSPYRFTGKAGKKRASHSLVESILRSSEDSQSDGHAASTYTLELGPWPTGETGWAGASGWDEESSAAVVGGVPGKLKLGVAAGPAAAAAAATLAGAALGPVSVLPQANLDNKG